MHRDPHPINELKYDQKLKYLDCYLMYACLDCSKRCLGRIEQSTLCSKSKLKGFYGVHAQ